MEQFQIREMRETDIAQVEAIEQEIFLYRGRKNLFFPPAQRLKIFIWCALQAKKLQATADCGVCLAKAISPIWQWQKNTAETEWRKR